MRLWIVLQALAAQHVVVWKSAKRLPLQARRSMMSWRGMDHRVVDDDECARLAAAHQCRGYNRTGEYRAQIVFTSVHPPHHIGMFEGRVDIRLCPPCPPPPPRSPSYSYPASRGISCAPPRTDPLQTS